MIYEQETNIYQTDAIKDAIEGLDTDIQTVETTLTNGKNKVTFGTTAPSSTTGAVAGDLYYVRGTITNAQGQQVQSCTGVYRFDGSAWQPETMSQGIFGSISADNILTGILKAIKIEGPTSDTFWKLDTGEWQSHGTKSLTGKITAIDGTETTETYDVVSKTKIHQGTLVVNGRKYVNDTDVDGEDTTFADMGLQAEDMNYGEFANTTSEKPPTDLPDSSVTYPHGGIVARGNKITSFGGNGTDRPPENLSTASYRPKAILTPDYIELGGAENPTFTKNGQTVGNQTADRNILRLWGGWNQAKQSIVFLKYCDWYDQYSSNDGWVKKRNFYNPPIQVRPSWEIVPGEYVGIQKLYTIGCLANNRTDIYMTINLARPFSDDVQSVRVAGTLHARIGSTILENNTDFDSDTSLGINYAWDMYVSNDSNVSFRIRKWSGKWGSSDSQLYSNVFVTLTDVTIETFDYDIYE